MTRGPWIALALAGLILVNGCDVSERESEGQSPDGTLSSASTEGTASPPTTGGAMSALEDSIQATFDGDAETVCASQTDEYSDAILKAMAEQGFVDGDATCEEAMFVLSGMVAGFGGVGYALDEVSVLAESDDGKTVTMRATYTGGQSNNETYEVSYIDGQWLLSGDAETKGTLSSAVAKSSH